MKVALFSVLQFISAIRLEGLQLKIAAPTVCYMFTLPDLMGLFTRHLAIHLRRHNSLNQMVLVTLMESYNVKIKHL